MDTATVTALIVLLTPVLTGMIKKVLYLLMYDPYFDGKTLKKFTPAIAPVVGALLAIAAERFGFVVTPELNSAIVGLFLGAAGSSVYDQGKTILKK